MYLENLVVRTKLTPLRPIRRTLFRPRMAARIMEALDYRLTILQAGAGYGKSTALTALTGGEHALVWYHLDVEDTDPLTFLVYLLHGFHSTFPSLSESSLAMLETWQSAGASTPLTPVIDTLVNELAQTTTHPTLLVLDDAHLLNNAPDILRILERLLKLSPPNLHIVLATRYPMKLASLVTMRVRGEVLEIGEEELAFTLDEIDALYEEQYDIALAADEVEAIAQKTEGWAIALQLIWQGMRLGERHHLPEAIKGLSGLKNDLFTFLAQEVLAQHEDMQRFLLTTAVLRQMQPDICDCVREADDSKEILKHLLDIGLFVIELDSANIRYHHLFHEFLYDSLPPEEKHRQHLKAANCYQARGEYEEAVYHFLRAKAHQEAAALIKEIGRAMVTAGRLETLGSMLGYLPPEALERQPSLLIFLGDLARLHSHFDEALRWYKVAEEHCRARGDNQGAAQALRGQARVYLDTVNPSQAEHLLTEAIRLSDGHEDLDTRVNLLELLAENQLNLGRTAQAKSYQEQANALREQGSDRVELSARVMLRTGRIKEACQILKARAEEEQQEPVLRPRAHREPLLLLSLLQSYLGESKEAYRNALEGIKRGQALDSPYVTAVGYMRQGHAWLLKDEHGSLEEARQCFERTIEIGDRLAVDRLKVEAYWGLCRTYGYRGEIARAEDVARRGIKIAEKAGDEWITAHIRLALGAAYVLDGQHDRAKKTLKRAYEGYQECSDTHGQALTWLWRCLSWHRKGDSIRLGQGLDDLLQLVYRNGYEHILTHRVMGGPPEPRQIVPLLLYAREYDHQASYADSVLAQIGLADVEHHPGYRLTVRALGAFGVWRGKEAIEANAWQREKARQLFQLLITWRGTMIDRDRICAILWPDLDADAAYRGFKVALNAVYNALEPDRGRGEPSAYITRSGSLYGLRPEADIWLDVEEFERLVERGDDLSVDDAVRAIADYEQALALNQGDYLAEYPYEEWHEEARARLRSLYVRTADRLARLFTNREQWEKVIEVCEQILTRDNCWEQAYRLMMTAYMHLGNRPQAIRSYQLASERLHEELDTTPSQETQALYQTILSSPDGE